jgi:uncharacterized membrane protein (DUF485 family)
MKQQQYDWAAISTNKTFVKLHRKKIAFLLSLWVLGALPYLLLTICAGYAPELFKIRVLGRMNIGYLACMFQFFMIIAIGIYYTYRTNKDFDPLTKELLEEIHGGKA